MSSCYELPIGHGWRAKSKVLDGTLSSDDCVRNTRPDPQHLPGEKGVDMTRNIDVERAMEEQIVLFRPRVDVEAIV